MQSCFTLLRLAPYHLHFPGNYLTKPAVEVSATELSLEQQRSIARHLFKTLYASKSGVGLTANMVGLGLRIVVIDTGKQPLLLIDPLVEDYSDKQVVMTEANLCMPGISGPVTRAARVRVSSVDAHGNRRAHSYKGWRARVVLHELSMLEGQTFLDLVPPGELHVSPRLPISSSDSFQLDFTSHKNRNGARVHAFNPVTTTPDMLSIKESVLRQKAEPLQIDKWASEDISTLVSELFWLQHHLKGVGLAAPQVGLSLQLAVIDNRKDPAIVLINPEIIEYSPETEDDTTEGCLSLPGHRAKVRRALRVKVKTDSLTGGTQILEAEGYLARIMQHEIDHLNGIVYVDRLDSLSSLMNTDPATLAAEAMDHVWPKVSPDHESRS